jgi:hypothetical protein
MKHARNYTTGAHEAVVKTVVRKDLWVGVPRPSALKHEPTRMRAASYALGTKAERRHARPAHFHQPPAALSTRPRPQLRCARRAQPALALVHAKEAL